MDVSGLDKISGSVECATISGSIAYDHPTSGKAYMLVYHQAIHYPRLTSHFMCLMQIWMTGVRVNEITKLAEEPDKKNHSIIFDDPLNPNETLVTPLSLKGVTSYFPSRNPRASEYEDESIHHIDMTSKAPVW